MYITSVVLIVYLIYVFLAFLPTITLYYNKLFKLFKEKNYCNGFTASEEEVTSAQSVYGPYQHNNAGHHHHQPA